MPYPNEYTFCKGIQMRMEEAKTAPTTAMFVKLIEVAIFFLSTSPAAFACSFFCRFLQLTEVATSCHQCTQSS